eukprot:1815395-Heterocapsa_arctica.AAC.1
MAMARALPDSFETPETSNNCLFDVFCMFLLALQQRRARPSGHSAPPALGRRRPFAFAASF